MSERPQKSLYGIIPADESQPEFYVFQRISGTIRVLIWHPTWESWFDLSGEHAAALAHAILEKGTPSQESGHLEKR